MESCPYCGRPFKRLKSHLPHCKMAGDVKMNPALKVESRTGTVCSTEKWKKQNKDLTLITENSSKREKTKRKSDSPRVGAEEKLQPIQEVHTAESEINENIIAIKKGKGIEKPMKEYKKRQLEETKQVMGQKKTKSLTDTIKNAMPEVKPTQDAAKLHKTKGLIISSQANIVPGSIVVPGERKHRMKDLLVQNQTQNAVKPGEVRVKSPPNQESGEEPLDRAIGVLQNLPQNQSREDKIAGEQQGQTGVSRVYEYPGLEDRRNHNETKGSNPKLCVEGTCENLLCEGNQWEDCKQENDVAKSNTWHARKADGRNVSVIKSGAYDNLQDPVCKNHCREKKQPAKVLAALEKDEHLASYRNCAKGSTELLPIFKSAQPSLLTGEKEERNCIYAACAKVMQTLSTEQASESVLQTFEELTVHGERPVKHCLEPSLNDKPACASVPLGNKTIHSGSLGLQYFPEFHHSYLRLNIVSERPFCQKTNIWRTGPNLPSEGWQAWGKYYKHINMKTAGVALPVLVAGCWALTYALHHELFRT